MTPPFKVVIAMYIYRYTLVKYWLTGALGDGFSLTGSASPKTLSLFTIDRHVKVVLDIYINAKMCYQDGSSEGL